jgi:hypothetical protein
VSHQHLLLVQPAVLLLQLQPPQLQLLPSLLSVRLPSLLLRLPLLLLLPLSAAGLAAPPQAALLSLAAALAGTCSKIGTNSSQRSDNIVTVLTSRNVSNARYTQAQLLSPLLPPGPLACEHHPVEYTRNQAYPRYTSAPEHDHAASTVIC